MKQAILHNCTPTAWCRRTTTGRLLLITLLLCTFLGGAKAQETTLTVCDGSAFGTTTTTNSCVPIYGLYVDTQGQNSEFIIPAETEGMSDLTGGTISKLTFYITNSPDTWGSPTVQVYMGEVEGTTLSSLNGPTDFTTVWTGELSNQNATMEITLNTPYTYKGGNLLIGMYVQTKSSTYKPTSFSGITAPSGSSRYNSGSGSGTAQLFLPKTTFTYTPGSGPICAKPSTFESSEITARSASFIWENTGAGSYTFEYKKASDSEWTVVSDLTKATYTQNNLEPATAYIARVKAVCGNGSESGYRTANFTTDCEAISTYPWMEDFDSYTGTTSGSTNNLPICWNYINTCTYSSYKGYPVIYNSSSYSNSPNNHLKFNSYASSNEVTTYDPQPQYAILPQMQNVSNLRMKLYARAYSTTSSTYYDATFHVGIMTNPADATTFREVASYNPSSTTYEQYTIPFNTYTGNGTYIAIKIDKADLVSGYSSIYHSVCIDDILVEEIPDCIEPTDLAEVTATTHSVTFGWTANNGETTWKVQYKKGDATDWTTVSEPVTSNPYTLSGLDASSVYQVRVAAWCTPSDPEGISEYSNPITVITACGANTVDADHHYTENFNSYTASTGTSAPTGYPDDELPLCWQFLNRSTNTSSYPMVFLSSYSGYHVSGNCLFFKSSSTTPLYAILPEFTNNISDLMLTFTYRNESTTISNGTLIVGYMTDPTDAATFTAVHTCDRTTTLTEQEVLFADAPAGSYIAFEYQGGSSNNYYLAIDDVMVGLIPSCMKPKGLTKDATTAHTATLHWTNGVEGQDAWQIAYSTTADFNPDEVTPVDVTTNPATIEGLTQSTNYYAYVRSNCGNGDFSEWCYKKVSFTTLAGNVTPTGLAVDASTITTNQATVSWSGVAGNTLHQSYDIYWAPATVTEVPDEPAAPNLITGITATSQTITGLEAETGYKVWVRDNCGTDGYSDWSSATTFTTASSCQTPDGLAASEVTLTSAKITWNTYGLTGFNLRYSDDKGDTWTTVVNVNSPYTFPNNLTVSTPYQVQVQATCNTAEWSEVLSFRTKCDVITITDSHHFFEDFEYPETTAAYNTNTVTDLVMPSCWDNYTITTSSDSCSIPHIIKSTAGTDGYNYSNPASQVLYFYGIGSGYAALPEFSNPLNKLQISFKWATESSSYGSLTLGYITNEDDGTYNTFTPIGESFAASSESFRQMNTETVYLNTVPAEATRLAFRWYYHGQYGCNIDDVEVSLLPSCYPVGTVSAATDVTYNSAKLSWALIDDTQDEWIVQYATNATFTEGVVTKTATTNTDYVLTGLTPGTPYWVRVKAACSTTDDWSNVITFETEEFCPVIGVTADNITQTTADLSWTGGSDSYNIRYRMALTMDTPLFSEDFSTDNGDWTMVGCYSETGINSDAFRFHWTTTPPQYLISPEITGIDEEAFLQFDYRDDNKNFEESFQVGYSTTNNETASFTFGTEITTTKDKQWKTYSGLIPANTKYIAIKCTSDNQYYLFIDNIVIAYIIPAGTWQNTTSTTTTAQLTGLTAGTKYEVQVQGVCDGTPGNWSTPACYFTTFDGLELADNDSEKALDKKNSYLISHDDGTEKNVMLLGRKLWKDGNWNTLCLPFNMTAEQVTAQLNPAINGLMELDVTNKWSLVNNQWSMDDNGTYQTGLDTDGTLYLYFKNASEITANKPYIIKWDASDPNYIQNPVFTGVIIDDSRYDVEFTGGMFVGTRDYTQFYDVDTSFLLLGADNTLYYPQPDLTDPDNPVYPSIGAFRAYFQLHDPQASIRAFRLNFGDDEATGIISVHDSGFMVNGSDAWYTLDGRRLDGQPTAKGLYIHGGKKVVIK